MTDDLDHLRAQLMNDICKCGHPIKDGFCGLDIKVKYCDFCCTTHGYHIMTQDEKNESFKNLIITKDDGTTCTYQEYNDN